MNREKMTRSLLLLLSLTSCVSGALVVMIPQTSYQAEENQDVTLEWTFEPDSSPDELIIYCEKLPDPHPYVLFHLHKGVEIQSSQDKRFAGRVQFDKDVLGEGRLRLRMSGLRTDDSGEYVCQVFTDPETLAKYDKLSLNVSAAAADSGPRIPTELPEDLARGVVTHKETGPSQGLVGLYFALAVSAAAILVAFTERQISARFCAAKSKQQQEAPAVDV